MGKTILAADDSESIRQMIRFSLQGAGHELIEVSDGAQALAWLESQAADLIITDLDMPKLDGLSLIRKLRAMPDYRRVPVVVLTTESDGAVKQKARAAGATGWITKPFTPRQLVGVVQKILN